MTDNGGSHTFVYDVFGRLRFVKTRGGSPAVVSEHRYNGLGYRIGWHYDVTRSGGGDPDGTVDSNDPWYYFTYDDRWRIVATFRGSDTYAKERFFHHNAGFGGEGGGSYIDALILRDRDASTVWASAADSTAEERVYYCQNWRADVVSLLKNTTGGSVEQLEAVRYTAYGVPFGLPEGDVNSDGVCDFTDYLDVLGLSSYDVRADINLDGVINDEAAVAAASGGSLGLGQLSLEADSSSAKVGNRIGYAGYVYEAVSALNHIRHRGYNAERGTWISRDFFSYSDGSNLYQYVLSAPTSYSDWSGLISVPGSSLSAGLPPPVQLDGYDCVKKTKYLVECLNCCSESGTATWDCARQCMRNPWDPRLDPERNPNDWNRPKCKGNCLRYAACSPNEDDPYAEPPGIPKDKDGKFIPYGCTELKQAMRELGARDAIDGKCYGNYYPIAVLKRLTGDHDFHFYRQDSDGRWTDKPGCDGYVNPPFDDPRKEADREKSKRGGHDTYCGIMCWPFDARLN